MDDYVKKPLPHPLRIATPWNPSPKAISKVKNVLPAPTHCPYCGRPVELVPNSVVYGKPYGEWPWLYLCTKEGCGAYVGLHPFTAIPLGTLARTKLRHLRKAVKDLLNPLWRGKGAPMQRTQAYHWLAAQLEIQNPNECHVGWFDIEQCEKAIIVLRKYWETNK